MSEGLTTGGSIGGGMNIDITLLKGELGISFENMQESKNFGSVVGKFTPFLAIDKVVNAMKGMHDVLVLSSLTITTQLSPPVTPIGAGAKVPGLMSRKA
ncbi:hypothetical protein [Candidatus Bandiella euplotis]|uniref:Uncharacterized protein n=1 Tax=Candidatus Bandiella euplotis TaxID=1664265 RepID=A0ABZ0UMW7_9RICK|nr:hypothetical protein [Candidatus Bandiella woodruffii]WPX96872.1 hypothetical protein Bandiella_01006 [Candidatus Bandiella woodruffii]